MEKYSTAQITVDILEGILIALITFSVGLIAMLLVIFYLVY